MSGLEFMPGSVAEPAEYEVIRRMWAQGVPLQAISEAVGMTARRIDHLRAAGKLNLPTRGLGAGHKLTQRLPSPSEIRKRCAAVRAGWSPEEEQQRRAGSGSVMSPTAIRQAPMRYGRMAMTRGVKFLEE